MITLDQLKLLSNSTPSKIVMLVLDGLGGLPDPSSGKTELETANTPNMDKLASKGSCGLSVPIDFGITPGSGPGHLALFGYDPFSFGIGRGVLEALGIGFDLLPGDVASRGNFCTVDKNGFITDRRAGRISTEKCSELCRKLKEVEIKGVELFSEPVKEHRFLFVMRGNGLSDRLSDTDPQKTGTGPIINIALEAAAEYTQRVVVEYVQTVAKVLSTDHPANMVLLRGFSTLPTIPTFREIYKLKPLAIAQYPMYKGLAKLVGMDIANADSGIKKEFDVLSCKYNDYDFFFIHIKGTDSAGEDGDFMRKVEIIEKVDSYIAEVMKLNPDVLIITGDHSTPSLLKGHSWHPVPFLLSSRWCRGQVNTSFSEACCRHGELGIFQATNIMSLAMGHGMKLAKYGA